MVSRARLGVRRRYRNDVRRLFNLLFKQGQTPAQNPTPPPPPPEQKHVPPPPPFLRERGGEAAVAGVATTDTETST